MCFWKKWLLFGKNKDMKILIEKEPVYGSKDILRLLRSLIQPKIFECQNDD